MDEFTEVLVDEDNCQSPRLFHRANQGIRFQPPARMQRMHHNARTTDIERIAHAMSEGSSMDHLALDMMRGASQEQQGRLLQTMLQSQMQDALFSAYR